MIPLIGFAPDADPMSPGVLTDCVNVVPTDVGFEGGPAQADAVTGLAALAAECRGSAVLTSTAGTRRHFAGTQTKLYEVTGTTWTDVTRVVSLSTPGIAAGTGSGTGGTLAAATYYVKITAVDSGGNQTAAGPESTGVTTTGTTSSIAYTWTAVSGASSYRIYYGTTAGGEAAYYTSATNSFTLTATAGTAGTPPTAVEKVNYTGSTENRWLFDQFGNAAIAANETEKIQASTSGAFADIATAPKAKIIFTTDNFVMALNVDDATFGDQPDGWWCSAYKNHALWTPDSVTKATQGRLIGAGGPLTAGLRLGPYAVAYKATSLFLGSYVDTAEVWRWERIPGEIGCIGPEALCDIGGAHIFIGEDNFWLFDGTRPIPLATGVVRQWFFDNSNASLRYRSIVKYDRQNDRVWLFYPSASATSLDSALVYSLTAKRWGRANHAIEAAVNFVTPGITWDTLTTLGASWDALPNIPWDSQLWQAGGRALAVFNSSHQLKILGGASTGGGITTGDFGDDFRSSMLRASRLRFKQSPTSATATTSYKRAEGDSLVVGGTSTTLGDGKFDHRQSARFHRIAYTMTGPFEVMGVQPDLKPTGPR